MYAYEIEIGMQTITKKIYLYVIQLQGGHTPKDHALFFLARSFQSISDYILMRSITIDSAFLQWCCIDRNG